MSDYISREQLINEWDDLGRRYAMPTTPIHKRAFRAFPSADAISIDQANAMIKSYVSHYEENKGEWIPVTERLPEIHQYVLLSLRSLDIEVGFRAETEPYFYCHGADGCYIEPQNVLAWQPLPEPYEKGGAE